MKRTTATREIIETTIGENHIRGTYHLPSPCEPQTKGHGRNSIGVLFVNPGVLPRAATGDSAVYWADSFAKCGYPSFRFDLPGLGESDGDLPNKVIDFQCKVNEGEYAPALSGIIDFLVDRYTLAGVVVLAHCAGAVSALYAGSTNAAIKGLVLLDPYFYLQQSFSKRNLMSHWHMRLIRQIEDANDQTVVSGFRAARVKVFLLTRGLYLFLKGIRLRALPAGLPGNANLPLIRCWNKLVSGRVPILVLRASMSTSKPGEFDYFGYLMPASSPNNRLAGAMIEGATHSFGEISAREAVRKFSETWLREFFPQTQDVSRESYRERSNMVRGSAQRKSRVGSRLSDEAVEPI